LAVYHVLSFLTCRAYIGSKTAGCSPFLLLMKVACEQKIQDKIVKGGEDSLLQKPLGCFHTGHSVVGHAASGACQAIGSYGTLLARQ
jgi:hypothetical protein